uniref:Uncharacterized protein n=1 Tax=Arundo donax TaxID=35708 RepID=A0A0A9BY63_ARUDO
MQGLKYHHPNRPV